MANSSILFIKDLDRIDCAVWDDAEGIFGASWIVDVEIEGERDHNGFIYDFSHLKSKLREMIKQSVDHALVVPTRSDCIDLKVENGFVSLVAKDWSYFGPKSSIYFLDSNAVTENAIAEALSKAAAKVLPSSVSLVKISLREEVCADGLFFRYTHGITNHDGNCQRLFHGHRSQFAIAVDGKNNTAIANDFLSSTLGKMIHIVGKNQITEETADSIKIKYRGTLGEYSGTLPKNRTLTIEGETSVETISEVLLSRLLESKIHLPSGKISLACYEGIDKGAIATTNL